MDIAKIRSVIFGLISSHFERLGFRVTNDQDIILSLRKMHGQSFVDIILGIGEHWSGDVIYCSISGYIYFDSVDGYFQRYALKLHNAPTTTIGVEPKNMDRNNVVEVRSDDEAHKAAIALLDQYINIILPLFHRLSSIDELDKQANIKPLERVPGDLPIFSMNCQWLRKMILAKLAGNVDYEKIAEHVLSVYEGAVSKDPASQTYRDALWVVEHLMIDLQTVNRRTTKHLIDINNLLHEPGV